MNDFDANGFLAGVFNEQPPVPTTPAATAPVQPEVVHSGDGRPELKDLPVNWPEGSGTERTSTAIDATAGQVDDLGDLLPADGEWDELPEPTPCPVCGEILAWWGVWDERRCERCEPAGQRSLLLADRAARLRARAKQ